MDKDYLLWAKENQSNALIPNALLEPRHSHEGVGAALVVRAVLYFERAYETSVRLALADCFDEFRAATGDVFKFVWHNGKAAQTADKAKPMRVLAASLGENDCFDFQYMSGEQPSDACLWSFRVFGMPAWEEKMGTRGIDVLAFSWPMVAVQDNPDAFARLFFNAAQRLNAVHGHAGHAINLSPVARQQNESTEFWISQMMPGTDVGPPTANAVRDLKGQIKTVGWLTAIDVAMLGKAGGVRGLRGELPPSWFSLNDYGAGVVIRAGVWPESGAAVTEGGKSFPPPAYVVLDRALRLVRVNGLDVLQQGTVNGDAPVYNTFSSTNAWLSRFETSGDGLLAAKAALLDTPPLDLSNALPNPL
ncbi:DUF3396 domain-containing protein [Paraburkholderia sp. D15]|uniref:type VI immunity family protein n=1 Tax=Paraburkholderia sp. D15 TaxID=2880218 RepID=UPI00247981CF|nr:type VI immunity family protein [Paraburkholderia sp. D15]WGS49298.1 DUF3396 domain-containing protein [Paraburkholderia sp. D15]WKF57213.1 hypothetical protein HUO10_001692 [Paraburkholderia busanensis]